MPPLEPNPFRARHVRERPEDRFVADAKVAAQMIIGQTRGRIYSQIVGPFGVFEEMLNV